MLGTATNVYCQGCSSGVLGAPHICGIGVVTFSQNDISMKWCYTCYINYAGYHVCVTTSPPAQPPASTYACTHCWCVEDRSVTRYLGGLTALSITKVHEVCCGCGSRRATDEDIYPQEDES